MSVIYSDPYNGLAWAAGDGLDGKMRVKAVRVGTYGEVHVPHTI